MSPSSVVAWDEDAGAWIVVERAAVIGMVCWQVASRHGTKAAAERAVGLHDSAAVAWLLYDPLLGWRRPGSRGWTDAISLCGCWTEAEARAILGAEPGLELRVVRANGRVTHPDIDPAPETQAAPLAAVPA